MTGTDMCIKKLWEENLMTEISHLHKAAELLKKYEKKDWCEVIKNPEFPSPISLHENIDYVRDILATTVQFTTGKDDTYTKVEELPRNADFFRFQNIIQPSVEMTPSHKVIDMYLRRHRTDYRYQVAENPIEALRNRREDNTSVGRIPGAACSTDFKCNKCC
jgi:hypothetical protein